MSRRTHLKWKILKPAAVFILINLLYQLCFPVVSFALTSGPSQPEFSSFEPVNTTDMVDLFTGDFNYNIPLLDIEGYPVNISYHSGITMDQEASWVGLGWNINPGVINRNVRGLPDDFNGDKDKDASGNSDQIEKDFNMAHNWSVGLTGGAGIEVLGFIGLEASLGITYNNYRGIGLQASLDPSFNVGLGGKSMLTLGLKLDFDSYSGIGFEPALSLSYQVLNEQGKGMNGGAHIGIGYNSRTGLKSLTFGYSAQLNPGKDGSSVSGSEDADKILESGINGGSAISFGSQTFTPEISFPMTNYGLNIRFTGGGSESVLHPHLFGGAFVSDDGLAVNSTNTNAYGYLYSENAGVNDLLDFNREKDGPYATDKPNLPVTNFTYDIYSVAGQGIGGMYRPFRGEIGSVYDHHVESGDGANISFPLDNIEAGVGGAPLILFAHLGINVNISDNTSSSGKWDDGNAPNFKNYKNNNNPLYEPFYFKQAGEKTQADLDFLNNVGNITTDIHNNPSIDTKPVRLEITGSGDNSGVTGKLVNGSWTSPKNASDISKLGPNKNQREDRNQEISLVTLKEITPFDPYLDSYDHLGNVGPVERMSSVTEIPRTSSGAKPDHIAQISALRPDGTTYVYGIPTYNTDMEEISFNSQHPSVNSLGASISPTVKYSSSDLTGNNNGLSHFVNHTKTPPYAYGYLLTKVLSPDYVDVTQNGITPDDLGKAVKFNYTEWFGADSKPANQVNNSPFTWRTPFDNTDANAAAMKAKSDQGLISDPDDDKGSIIYGQKDIWYLHSIETKNYIAHFITSDRQDGLPVTADNGQNNFGTTIDQSIKLQKLDRIDLYSKNDIRINGDKAIPIKSIHFNYSYTLCPGVDNNVDNYAAGNSTISSGTSAGKLTLTKIWFTYANSKKGELSPYIFKYHDEDPQNYNPHYQVLAHDRWSNYAPNTSNSEDLQLSEFPYVTQNKADADKYVSAWTLTDIGLPSGGNIHIDYEADDYAFVQDKPAMQMFKLLGAGKTSNYSSRDGDQNNSSLYNANGNNDYLFFDIPAGIDFQGKFINGQSVYYKCLVNVDSRNSKNNEYISGMSNALIGIAPDDPTKGYIKLDEDQSTSTSYQTITKTAWDFTKINLPAIAYPAATAHDGLVKGAYKALASFFFDMQDLLDGFYGAMQKRGNARTFVPSHSWVRLNTPYHSNGIGNQKILGKLGGGSRVKRLTMNDRWDQMNQGNIPPYQNASYGQEYHYTLTGPDDQDANGNPLPYVMSSGVVSYEPMIGNDENPFFNVVSWSHKNPGVVDDYYQVIQPMGESFYPSPVVGYSRVTVRSLSPLTDTNDPVKIKEKSRPNGYAENTFYTSKDFPTICKETNIDPHPYVSEPNIIESILWSESVHDMTVSQGYSIELNDMHGKPRAEISHGASGEITSSVEYIYKTDGNGKLDNTVSVIYPDGTSKMVPVGVDVDAVADMRQSDSHSESTTIQGNLDVTIIFAILAIIPLFFPTAIPQHNSNESSFKSAVFTKVVNRYGLIDKVVRNNEGSIITTQNIAYDAKTGEVLLTQTQNGYDDPVYSMTYPAHWAYGGMGLACENVGAQWNNVKITNGIISNAGNIISYLSPGDEILVSKTDGTPVKKVWAFNSGSNWSLIDLNGGLYSYSGNCNIKIVRSGKRNQASSPIESITMRTNPITNNCFDYSGQTVLNASATEYSDQWGLYCCGSCNTYDPLHERGNSGCNCGICMGAVINPYLRGVRGVWHPKRSLVYYDQRSNAQAPELTNARKDGTYSTFNSYWSCNSPNMTASSNSKWTWTSEVTQYSPFGFEIENQDALLVHSAALYGYNNSFPTAVASNAKFTEIGYDGFEDYDLLNRYLQNNYSSGNPVGVNMHWIIKDATGSDIAMSTAEHHTGWYSLPVTKGSNDLLTAKIKGCNTPTFNATDFLQYFVKPEDCIGNFEPSNPVYPNTTSDYYLSVWVNEKNDCGDIAWNNSTSARITITFGVSDNSSPLPIVLKPDGPVIDGWQKIEGKVSIPLNASSINISLQGGTKYNFAQNSYTYFDDLRFHPYKSNMKSFVYDPVSLRLMAILDENNYATFYEYDEEGKLVRQKKETAKGIITTKESRTSLQRTINQ
jgi:hypothetical protein